MNAVLERIEALPGVGRYALTFRRVDGGEQVAIAQISGRGLDVADASLPSGWTSDSTAFPAVSQVVLALHAVRQLAPGGPTLRDVDGGWDVGLGNVVLPGSGRPECTAHGPMGDEAGVWVCVECGARAVLA